MVWYLLVQYGIVPVLLYVLLPTAGGTIPAEVEYSTIILTQTGHTTYKLIVHFSLLTLMGFIPFFRVI